MLGLITLASIIVPVASAQAPVESRPSRARGHLEHRIAKSIPLPTEEASPFFESRLVYAQSAAAWTTVHDVRSAEGNLSALNQVLKREYGQPEEAMTSFAVACAVPLGDGSRADRIRFSAAAEGVGFGLVQNPVVPELHGDAVAMGVFGGGYLFHLDEAELDLSLGGAAGLGREKRIDATSTDLIESIPLRSGAVYLYGIDFRIARRFELDRENALRLSGSAQENLFETTTPAAASSIDDEGSSKLFHRWKAIGSLEHAAGLGLFDRGSLALEGIAGPQPLPLSVLPRAWDYAHNMYATPELGALFGAGLALRETWARASRLEAHLGYYGGYFGGSLEARLGWFDASVASWGIEDSAAYHVLGERLYLASIGLKL